MAIVITEECINCGACIDECPEGAIFAAGEEYNLNGEMQPPLSQDFTFIVPDICTECKTCIPTCAVEAIIEK